MNPYSDLSFPRPSDLVAPDDIAPSAPALTPTGQSEQPPEQHMDQSEIYYNPYADVFPSPESATTGLPARPALVRAESVNISVNADCFLSADGADRADAENPRGLSIVSAQFEAEAQFTSLDLECSICFSQFNNAFRCPKRLLCGHTFCLECLARMNVKSAEPGAVLCPLCRAHTPLPALGLPELSTDPQVLSRLPSSMQRVYSVRFLRSKGRLQLKRPEAAARTQSMRRSLDVGLPSPVPTGAARGEGGGSLFRLTDHPACRAFLLTAVIIVIVVLIAIVVFLLVTGKNFTP